MQVAVLFSAILAYVIVLLAFRRKVMQADRMERRIGSVAKIGAPSAPDVNELNLPFSQRFLKPAAQGTLKFLANMMPQT
jgi:hypothetical protein